MNKKLFILQRFFKGIEIFLIYIYPLVLITVVFTAWFAAIANLGFRPLPTINDPYLFGGPIAYWLHWPGHFAPLPLVSYPLPFAAFAVTTRSIQLINNDREHEFKWVWLIWGSMLLIVTLHPAYAWLLD